MTYEPHPAALLFPMMEGEALAELVEDIRTNGLLDPIVLYHGQVLDGRNRLRACELAEVEPHFEHWQNENLSPVEYVIAKNLHRRHLTAAQKAVIALEALPHIEARIRSGAGKTEECAQTRAGRRNRSVVQAGDLVGVGETSVATTKRIHEQAPELIEEMRAGRLTVREAERRAGMRPDDTTIYYGKGDKWDEATQPLGRYLRAWEKRGYEYRHLNPAQAAKRVQTIDRLVAQLQAARADLVPRSQRATLSVRKS